MKLFTFVIAMSALLVAGCAAFFSVKGIATLFSGAFIAAFVMAGALEIGKLVAVTFLHRSWGDIGILLRSYLATAVIVLMGITSLGIFGFLSSAYQDSALKHEIHISKIENIVDQKESVESEIVNLDNRATSLIESRKNQEQRLDVVTDQIGKTMTARSAEALQESTQKLIEDTNIEIRSVQTKKDNLFERKMKYEEDILELKLGNEGSKDIQTFEFVAREFNTDLDTVAKWFILLIIFVFDPLAVALVLSYNVLVVKYQKEKSEQIEIVEDDEIGEPDWPSSRVLAEADIPNHPKISSTEEDVIDDKPLDEKIELVKTESTDSDVEESHPEVESDQTELKLDAPEDLILEGDSATDEVEGLTQEDVKKK